MWTLRPSAKAHSHHLPPLYTREGREEEKGPKESLKDKIEARKKLPLLVATKSRYLKKNDQPYKV